MPAALNSIQRRRLRILGILLLLVCAGCFVVAFERNEAYSREMEAQAMALEDLPGVHQTAERPLISKVALILGLLTGPAGLGCILYALPPADRPLH